MRIVMLVSSGRRGGNTDGISVLLEKELMQLAQSKHTELVIDKYMLPAIASTGTVYKKYWLSDGALLSPS